MIQSYLKDAKWLLGIDLYTFGWRSELLNLLLLFMLSCNKQHSSVKPYHQNPYFVRTTKQDHSSFIMIGLRDASNGNFSTYVAYISPHATIDEGFLRWVGTIAFLSNIHYVVSLSGRGCMPSAAAYKHRFAFFEL